MRPIADFPSVLAEKRIHTIKISMGETLYRTLQDLATHRDRLENAKELGIYPTIHTLTLVAEALNVSLFALMLPMDAEQLRAIQGDQDFDRS